MTSLAGLGLVTILAARSNTVIFAGARNPSDALALQALRKTYPDKVYIVKLTSADREENTRAIEEFERVAGKLDVVIANAGIAGWFGPALECVEDVMMDHMRVNTLGPLVLFHCASQLLSKSTIAIAKFGLISSGAGSIHSGAAMPVAMLPDGAPKSAANYVVRKLHYECPWLTCVIIRPGGVDTDMARFASSQEEVMRALPLLTVEESASRCVEIVDAATRQVDSPRMINYDGMVWDW